MKLSHSVCSSLLFVTSFLGCESPVQTLEYFPLSEVHLTESWVKEREDSNISYVKSLNVESLLHNFRVNAGIPSSATPLSGWEHPKNGLRGHFTGHYLSAASKVVAATNDVELKSKLIYMIDVLDSCQQRLGGTYLSAFPMTDFDVLEQKCAYVWAPYYTLHKIIQGVVDVYAFTGNSKALTIAERIACFVSNRMDALTEQQIERLLYTRDANPINEPGAMNEALYNLYRYTNNPRDLELAKLFDRDWFMKPLEDNKNQLSGLHSNTHIAIVNGFAARLDIDQSPRYNKICSNFYNMITCGHCYANGTSSGPRPIPATSTAVFSEHWGYPGKLSATLTHGIAESCVTHNMQKLTAQMFRYTANASYADDYMNRFFNAVLPAKHPHTSQTMYHLPLGSPSKKVFLGEGEFKCCNGSGIEAYSSLSSNIYYHDDNSLWICNYIPSSLNWTSKGLKLTQTGDLLSDERITFVIETDKPSNIQLKFLIPSWVATGSELLINGESAKRAGRKGFVEVNRTWQNGDKIELVLNKDFYIKEMPDNDKLISIFYGPVMLAFNYPGEIILKGSKDSILKCVRKSENNPKEFILSNNDTDYKLYPLYDITDQKYGCYASIRNY